jgi:hypothetical protein
MERMRESVGKLDGGVGDISKLGSARSGGALIGAEGYRRVHDIAKRLGDPYPEVTAGQWAIESAWGRKPSGKFNYFGQKARAGEPGTARSTREVLGGRSVRMMQRFKDYGSAEEGIADHVKRWSRRYAGAHSALEAVQRLKQMGYATDPNYVGAVMGTIRKGEAALRSTQPTTFATDRRREFLERLEKGHFGQNEWEAQDGTRPREDTSPRRNGQTLIEGTSYGRGGRDSDRLDIHFHNAPKGMRTKGSGDLIRDVKVNRGRGMVEAGEDLTK